VGESGKVENTVVIAITELNILVPQLLIAANL
jgi:hypothetical protein